ncbi:MAG: hypothetical protein KC449_29950, partial [Anaerolineales bacterium]|nr:hypothetical protein [Anaerolineales bacterium]
MTIYTQTRQQTQAQKFLQKMPVRTAVLLICFLWTLPTVGMFVSSFRTANEIRTTGWWTAFVHPFQMSQWTLENYSTVLTADGMLNAFINSLIIT